MDRPESVAMATPRLALRDPTDADLAAVHRFRGDAKATRTMQFLPETIEESREWLAKVIHHNAVRPRRAYNLVIETAADKRVVGWIGFGPSSRSEERGAYGVGYMLGSDAWGRGYATEAVTAAVAFMRDALHANLVLAWCFTENAASARVLAKAGFRDVRRFAEFDPVSGRELDATAFELPLPPSLPREPPI
jgi:RimJ/RimL family protein N-acetyltransferase